MLRVLDGRNSNKVPQVMEISEDTIIEEITKYGEKIYLLLINGFYVPCPQTSEKGCNYDYVLCAQYKTRRGFEAWLNRFYN